MSIYVGAAEAARVLGVTKATLYAYVSRGLIQRRTAVDGRTSLYPRDDLIRLSSARRGRRRPVQRPSLDVQIASAVTHLEDSGVTYRGHDAGSLAESARFETVAELLWTGALPATAPRWRLSRPDLDRCRRVVAAADTADSVLALATAAIVLAQADPPSPAGVDLPGARFARRMLAVAPTLLGGPMSGDFASRLTKAWVRRPTAQLISAVDRTLVLLADHELATSTLAVRIACSVRATPADAIATGLHVVRGSHHGAAGWAAAELFIEAADKGAAATVQRRLNAGERLPGFGHTVYRTGDPRFPHLLDAVLDIPADDDAKGVVLDVIEAAGRHLGHAPNVDLAVGALTFVAGLPADAPLFAVARIAGWAAHYDEELAERPVRYRGLTSRS